jgi:hypothetical protein
MMPFCMAPFYYYPRALRHTRHLIGCWISPEKSVSSMYCIEEIEPNRSHSRAFFSGLIPVEPIKSLSSK